MLAEGVYTLVDEAGGCLALDAAGDGAPSLVAKDDGFLAPGTAWRVRYHADGRYELEGHVARASAVLAGGKLARSCTCDPAEGAARDDGAGYKVLTQDQNLRFEPETQQLSADSDSTVTHSLRGDIRSTR